MYGWLSHHNQNALLYIEQLHKYYDHYKKKNDKYRLAKPVVLKTEMLNASIGNAAFFIDCEISRILTADRRQRLFDEIDTGMNIGKSQTDLRGKP